MLVHRLATFAPLDSQGGTKTVTSSLPDLDTNERSRQRDAEEGHGYVAISHVWSDGLGNPSRNALPMCQVMRLQKHVDALDVSTKKPTPFWIDTLCIPHQSEYRRKAIGQMHWIYDKAKMILVLDASLYEVPASYLGSRPEDLLTRILICPWGRRLWTFQEGQSTTEVGFQFSGAALDLLEILGRIAALNFGTDRNSWVLGLHAIEANAVFQMDVTLTAGLRYFSSLLSNRQNVRDEMTQFREVARALYFRRTSWPGDEAICLAKMIGWHPEIMFDVSPELRMKRLIESLENVPPSIVFFRGPRYEEEGDRWIPRSFLLNTCKGVRLDETPFGQSVVEKAGLRVKLDGLLFQLHKEYPHAEYYGNSVIPIDYSDAVVEPDGTSLTEQFWVDPLDPNFSWASLLGVELALLFHDTMAFPNTHGYNERVVLVSIKRREGNRIYTRFERCVRIHLQVQVDSLPTLVSVETTTTPKHQQWCIG